MMAYNLQYLKNERNIAFIVKVQFLSTIHFFSFFNNFNITPSWAAYDHFVGTKICVDYLSDFYMYRRDLNGILKLEILHLHQAVVQGIIVCH